MRSAKPAMASPKTTSPRAAARPYPNLSLATRKPLSAMRSFSKPAQRVRQPGVPSPFRPMKPPITAMARSASPARQSALSRGRRPHKTVICNGVST